MINLTKTDAMTEASYATDGFVVATETQALSYTSARVANPLFNRYETTDKPKVFGYYTDWAQYDGRIVGGSPRPDCQRDQRGRGVDLALLDPFAFDKIILGFAGILGDTGPKSDTLNKAADTLKISGEGSVTLLDPWGDAQSSQNVGFDGYADIQLPRDYQQKDVRGILGGLRDKQVAAKALGHDLIISLSIGGWTLSDGFYHTSRDQEKRTNFCNSVIDFLDRFPMFTELDLDWEYPGAEGIGNAYGADDYVYYVELIKELKAALIRAGKSDVKISIAACANIEVLQLSQVPLLIKAGVTGINLMTYDFFGTPWADRLNHHTNLQPNEESDFSLCEAVDYLIENSVEPKMINIGYAGYTRNAKGAEIETFSPLKGSYAPGDGSTTGTFEEGTSEWYDIIYNYLDLNKKSGKNGFELYTDQVADADYLYSPESKLFMSLDTPRSVKNKGTYALERNLGGIFTWTIDQENGLLVNAAREGLGCSPIEQKVDMEPFYFKGINVDPSPENNIPELFVPDSQTVDAGQAISFQVKATDADDDNLRFVVSDNATLVSTENGEATITYLAPNTGNNMQESVTVTVSDGLDSVSQEVLVYVKGLGGNTAPVLISPSSVEVKSGQTVTFSVSASDADDDMLSFSASEGEVTPTGSGADVSYTADVVDLDISVNLVITVSDGKAMDTNIVVVTVIADSDYGDTWSPDVVYNNGECVIYKGHLWEAQYYIEEHAPGTDSAWTAMVQEDQNPVKWDKDSSYGTQSTVEFESNYWFAKWAPSRGEEPGVDQYGAWKPA
ncbi:chitinase [Shewanella psychrophila]|uniref:chitinase n=1 Tax=Shewanella psychrophila TaxID=225848 RepID=A0A1S6HM64_9GAMM|nr:glycosyl hydrolase family 18 protein [Shewanella psychrophila]AQS36626.1 chitinase [Shewanella psychrophila]